MSEQRHPLTFFFFLFCLTQISHAYTPERHKATLRHPVIDSPSDRFLAMEQREWWKTAAIRDRQVEETARDGGVKRDEAAGWRVHLGGICRLLPLEFNAGVAYELCVCVCSSVPATLCLHIPLKCFTPTVLLSNHIFSATLICLSETESILLNHSSSMDGKYHSTTLLQTQHSLDTCSRPFVCKHSSSPEDGDFLWWPHFLFNDRRPWIFIECHHRY